MPVTVVAVTAAVAPDVLVVAPMVTLTVPPDGATVTLAAMAVVVPAFVGALLLILSVFVPALGLKAVATLAYWRLRTLVPSARSTVMLVMFAVAMVTVAVPPPLPEPKLLVIVPADTSLKVVLLPDWAIFSVLLIPAAPV